MKIKIFFYKQTAFILNVKTEASWDYIPVEISSESLSGAQREFLMEQIDKSNIIKPGSALLRALESLSTKSLISAIKKLVPDKDDVSHEHQLKAAQDESQEALERLNYATHVLEASRKNHAKHNEDYTASLRKILELTTH